MRTLIDGYNVMFAGGLMGRKFGPDEFRQVRHRFLNDLAASMDATEAHTTTVVFDAATAPPDRSSTAHHKGITVLFAVDADDADSLIEELIAHHSSPKTLTVVSSDIRIKTAAHRRRARVVTADEYWTIMDDRKSRPKPARVTPAASKAGQVGRATVPSAREADAWAREFADVDEMDEARELFHPHNDFITDADLARVMREVEAEFRR